MKKIIFFSLFVGYTLTSFSQKGNLMLNRPTINSIDSIEKANKGELFKTSISFSLSKDYFPNADKYKLANPFIYFRKGEKFTIEMNYYYSLPDSMVRLVSYSWDGNQASLNDLEALYHNNSIILSKYFGTTGEEKNENQATYLQKSKVWQNNEVYVKQFIITSQSTNRVRVLVSWK